MPPRATYRIQFHKAFPFKKGEALAGYLQRLGVSHVYSSPILTARAGSSHGYDVVDFCAVNPELGGMEAFRSMAAALRSHGIGIILDIVPNHMAVGGADNFAWLDVLEHGPASAYASWFDIDFDGLDVELRGKILAPYLGAPYREVLASGELELVEDAQLGKLAIAYHHHRFPIRPQDVDEVRSGGLERFDDPDLLHDLLERQNFSLAWWRVAGDRVNYRRFFDITELAGVRIENREAFETTHRIIFDLYAEGLIDGVRIDHIDGLTDPAGYCDMLRKRLDELQAQRPKELAQEPTYVVVEKILAAREWLPDAWPVEGTTGYDFMNEVSALQHDDAAKAALQDGWAALSGRHASFEEEEIAARKEMLRVNFCGQLETVVDAMTTLKPRMGDDDRDLTRAALHRALSALVEHFRVYRVYATGRVDTPLPGEPYEEAMTAAQREPAADVNALAFIDRVMRGSSGDADVARAIRRFNQLTAPIAAKAVEDTAFYRYGRLLSRNDVGFDAERLGMSNDEFHERMRLRAERASHSMLATATHDHKRGEDVRARMAVLSEMPERWLAGIADWQSLNAAIHPARSDPGDEAMLYQMIVGAWPLDLAPDDGDGLRAFAERLAGWREKSLREAKLRSTWIAPDAGNETAAQDFLRQALDPSFSADFLESVHAFVETIAPAGAANGLVQLALRMLLPGVPDTYQGTELWDFSLVDPDNRRPVDYALRETLLAKEADFAALAADWRDGAVKMKLMQTLLGLRARMPKLFAEGDYTPVEVTGRRASHILAFSRKLGAHEVLVAAALRLHDDDVEDSLVPSRDWWGNTQLAFKAKHTLRPVLTSGQAEAFAPLAANLFGVLPVSVWTTEGG